MDTSGFCPTTLIKVLRPRKPSADGLGCSWDRRANEGCFNRSSKSPHSSARSDIIAPSASVRAVGGRRANHPAHPAWRLSDALRRVLPGRDTLMGKRVHGPGPFGSGRYA